MRTAVEESRTVLVVDDDPWIRSVLVEVLEGEGYAVLQARTGGEGLRLAEQQAPNVLLLDLALPTYSGVDVLRQLKGRPATRGIPVVVVSAHPWVLPAGEARRVARVLPKPFDLQELLAEVERAAN